MTALQCQDCREQCATPCSSLQACGTVPKGGSLEAFIDRGARMQSGVKGLPCGI
jgi:hypothetical protein